MRDIVEVESFVLETDGFEMRSGGFLIIVNDTYLYTPPQDHSGRVYLSSHFHSPRLNHTLIQILLHLPIIMHTSHYSHGHNSKDNQEHGQLPEKRHAAIHIWNGDVGGRRRGCRCGVLVLTFCELCGAQKRYQQNVSSRSTLGNGVASARANRETYASLVPGVPQTSRS